MLTETAALHLYTGQIVTDKSTGATTVQYHYLNATLQHPRTHSSIEKYQDLVQDQDCFEQPSAVK